LDSFISIAAGPPHWPQLVRAHLGRNLYGPRVRRARRRRARRRRARRAALRGDRPRGGFIQYIVNTIRGTFNITYITIYMNKIVIVPGNPGSSLLYIEFVEILKHTTNGYEFFILDHGVDKNRNVSLTEQIQNVIDQLNQIIQTGDRVYVIGHSIGAYMVLHALHGSHCKEIAKVFLMFPFLEADLSVSRARLLNIVCKCHKSIGIICGYLSFLPHGFKRAYSGPAPMHPNTKSNILLSFLSIGF
jgi:alpha-beta hydrolase superfamily lysophospholipase